MFSKIKKKIKKEKKKIILPETNDKRILEVGLKLAKKNLATVVFVGKKEKFKKSKNIEIIEEKDLSNIKKEDRAAYLLAKDKGDCALLGAKYLSGDVLKGGFKYLKKEKDLVSSLFILKKKKQQLYFADCAFNPNPTSDDLVTITKNSANSVLKFEKEVVAALLSYSSKGSSLKESALKVKRTFIKLENQNLPFEFEGEIQFDAAFDVDVRNIKVKQSKIKDKKVNLYVFPSLDSGNIAYKIMNKVAKYEALGPIISGFDKPYNDLSRGGSKKEIYKMALITLNECFE